MKYLLLFLGILISPIGKGQDLAFGWAKNIPGVKMCTDDSDNLYIAGRMSGSFDFDPGAGVYDLTAGGSGSVYIAKYTSDGNLAWAFLIGNNGNEGLHDIATDKQGHLVLVGDFYTNTDLNPDPNIVNNFVGSKLFYSFVIVKYSSQGKFLKAKQIETNFIPYKALISTENGSIFFSFIFNNSLTVDGKNYFNRQTTTYQIALAKLDSSWQVAWVSGYYSKNASVENYFGLDANQNLYVTGNMTDTAIFGLSADSIQFILSSGNTSFVAKWDNTGRFSWMKPFTGKGTFTPSNFVVDYFGNCIVSGKAYGDLDFNPGPDTVKLDSPFQSRYPIISLDSAGNFRWGGIVDNSPSASDIKYTTQKDGSILLIRNFGGNVNVYLLGGRSILTCNNFTDFYIAKYTTFGNLVWYKTIIGSRHDMAYYLYASNSGNVFISGFFHDTVDFDPGPGIFNMIAETDNSFFTLKLTPTFPTGIANPSNESEPFQLYPNPTSNNLTIRFNQPVSNASLKLFDIQGREVITQNGVNGSSQTLQMEGLATSLYFLNISSNGICKTLKVLKSE